MSESTFSVNAAIQVLKPVEEVFEAIVDPEKMTNYFISKSTGRMEEGSELLWTFPEFEGESRILVGKIETNKLVSFYWEIEGKFHLTQIELTGYGDRTKVSITETGGQPDEAGINWLKGNTEGWANFLACLKAWLEYGIHLRKGAFDYPKTDAQS